MKAKIKIIPGMRFGKLVTIKKVKKLPDDKDKHDKWLCQCDCGNTTIVRSNTLREGKTKSCGCLLRGIKDMKGMLDLQVIVLPYGVVSVIVAMKRL